MDIIFIYIIVIIKKRNNLILFYTQMDDSLVATVYDCFNCSTFLLSLLTFGFLLLYFFFFFLSQFVIR